MRLTKLRHGIALVALLGGAFVIQALPVEAAGGPTVVAVHQNGAVDVPGNSTPGVIASMTVPAGNWSITATATIIGEAYVHLECRLYAGSEFYKSHAEPSSQGVASYQPIVLLLAHHFAKRGTVSLKCDTDASWTSADLIRDIHVTAMQVGQLTDGGTTTGTGSPQTYYSQNSTLRGWTNNNYQLIEELRLPAGTWFVQGAAWGDSPSEGDRIDCTLASSSTTADQSIGDFQDLGGMRNVSVLGVLKLTGPDDVTMNCKDADGLWLMDGSAMSAMSVGTFKYGPLGGSATTMGTGTPTIVGGYTNVGGISDTAALAPIGSLPLSAGSWFVMSRLSFEEGASTPNVTCQTKLATSKDQGRAILDSGNDAFNFSEMSLTRTVSVTTNAVVACNQSAGSLGAFFADLKVFAIKAGSLTDTDLD